MRPPPTPRTAVLFPGQGSQRPGDARRSSRPARPDLLERVPRARRRGPLRRASTSPPASRSPRSSARRWPAGEAPGPSSAGRARRPLARRDLRPGRRRRARPATTPCELVVAARPPDGRGRRHDGGGCSRCSAARPRTRRAVADARTASTVANDNAPGQVVLSGPRDCARLARRRPRELGLRAIAARRRRRLPLAADAAGAWSRSRAALDDGRDPRAAHPRLLLRDRAARSPTCARELADGAHRARCAGARRCRAARRRRRRDFVETGPGMVLAAPGAAHRSRRPRCATLEEPAMPSARPRTAARPRAEPSAVRAAAHRRRSAHARARARRAQRRASPSRCGVDDGWIAAPHRHPTRATWPARASASTTWPSSAGRRALERRRRARRPTSTSCSSPPITADELTPNAAPLVAARARRDARRRDRRRRRLHRLPLGPARSPPRQVEAGRAARVLVIGADLLTRITDLDDRATAALFGDGAGAVVVAPPRGAGLGSARSCSGADGAAAGADHDRPRRRADPRWTATRPSSTPSPRLAESHPRVCERAGPGARRRRPVRLPPGQRAHPERGRRAARR